MILYGKPVVEKIYENLKQKIEGLERKPFLAIILVGENPASVSYVKIKEKIADKLSIGFKMYHFPKIVSQENVEELITKLNQNKFVTGIVVQLPLPEKIDAEKIIGLVDREKDVDGLSSQEMGRFSAPTAKAILDILDFYQIDISSKKTVILGRGKLVGAPLEKMLKEKNIDVIVCDSQTPNLKEKTLQANILISATGVPGLVKSDMVKSDAVIIDAGTAEADGKMVGDVDSSVYEKVGSYTPTPGGVGPVTVAELFSNLLEATKE